MNWFRPRVVYPASAAIALVLCLWVADSRYPPNLLMPDYSTRVYDRHGQLLWRFASPVSRVFRYEREARLIPRHYKDAVLAFEDRWFYWHPGVNPLSMLRAGVQWIANGSVVSGGSTITMQLVRMQHDIPRTLVGKLLQITRAVQYEWHYSKEEILHAYIDKVPMGGAIEGVEAAARHYFATGASALTLSQSLVLAGIPQWPERLRPDVYPERAESQRNKLLGRYAAIRGLDDEQYFRISREPVIVQSETIPQAAYWTAESLRRRYPHKSRLPSTIDLAWQRNLQSLVDRIDHDRDEGSAIVVLDNHRGEVRALAGKHGSKLHRQAWIDLSQVVRSPGSALKPFLYAMALEKKLVHSESMLSDVPQSFAGYRPGNFNRRFHGAVSVSEALQHSLNVPAVSLLEQVSVPAFAELLKEAGLHRSEAEPNLSLVLGGTGTRLMDLVGAFRALAANGERVEPTDTPLQAARVSGWLQPSSTWIIADILSEISPPSGYKTRRKVAWKTGTSWGGRDAWAIGVSADYTVGVWKGSVKGSGDVNRSGYYEAGELLFDAFNLLPADIRSRQRPGEILEKQICWPGGRHVLLVNSSDCIQTRRALTISGVTPATLGTRPNRWPDELLQWQRDKRVKPVWQGKPEIKSIVEGQRIAAPDIPIALQATSRDVVDWYLDGEWLPYGLLYPDISTGEHQLTVVDGSGRYSNVKFTIE